MSPPKLWAYKYPTQVTIMETTVAEHRFLAECEHHAVGFPVFPKFTVKPYLLIELR